MNYWHRRCPVYLIASIAIWYGAFWYLEWSDVNKWFSFPTFILLFFGAVAAFAGGLYYFIEGCDQKEKGDD